MHDTIDSRNHHHIKRIRRLHDRAERDHSGLFYVEGMRFVARAMRHRIPIEVLVVCRALLAHPFARHLVWLQNQTGTPILEVAPEVMASLALMEDPQAIGEAVRQARTTLKGI